MHSNPMKMVNPSFSPLLLLLCFMACTLVTAVPNLTTDQSALLEFKAHVRFNPQNLLNWSTSASVCNWVGVSCGARHKRVTALTLANFNHEGIISPYLGNLSFLISLDLSFNHFHGDVPKQLGQLRRLKIIRLRGNYLSGFIPSSMYNISSLNWVDFSSNNLNGRLPDNMCNHLPKLEFLNLQFNQLSGEIPLSLGKCSDLEILSLATNKFTGSIPPDVGNLTMLKELYLGDNNFRGEIPWELGNLINLEAISAPNNSLIGSIPPTIFNISSMIAIKFPYNKLFGSLPLDLCHHLPVIEHIDFYDNKLTGSLPKDIVNCTQLRVIQLPGNFLTGEIPHEIDNLHYLELFDIAENNFKGVIPSTLFNVSTMKIIDLTENNFFGQLPPSTAEWLPNLEELFLAVNKLTGIIPSSIANASKLSKLELSRNSFSGPIPNTIGNLKLLQWLNLVFNNLTNIDSSSTTELSFLSSMSNCQHLRHLDISFNPLNGFLPRSIGNLSATIEQFGASSCNIKGIIPIEIGNLSSVIIMSLASNDLIGSIPSTIERLRNLQGLFLYNNKLEGSIPTSLCQLESLNTLSLDGNKLQGSVPTCFDKLVSLRHLDLSSNKLNATISPTLLSLKYILEIDLSSNSFSGNLPMEIGGLKVLTSIDLTRNQLSGNIPSSIGDLTDLTLLSFAKNRFQGHIPESFGNLKSLESLDVSNNNISGVIPKSLEALSYLKFFNVSFNRLQGEIPEGGPFANFSIMSFLSNGALCGPARLHVPPCKTTNRRTSMAIPTLVMKYILPAVALVILVLALILLLIRYRSRRANRPATATLLPLATWRQISYYQLQQATNRFCESNLIGKGSFGSVYKGTLADGMEVAIKVFNLEIEGAFKSFDAECEVLRNIRHRNLLKIITSCCSLDFKALVIEFMPNGSLDKWLYSHNNFLDIIQRMNIMIDVASALEYLHHDYSTVIIHCDLKPNNIFLDEDMMAHVGDFGIAKLLGEGESVRQTMTLATIGYMAPEYGLEGIISLRSDAYSYGILLIEVFTRTKPTDERFGEEMGLKHWVEESLISNSIIKVVDSNLLRREEQHFNAKIDCVSSVMRLALDCCAESPEKRINMKDALAVLMKIKMKFLKDARMV